VGDKEMNNSRKEEIGGYFELEQMSGESYYEELLPMNLGRCAFRLLLEARECKLLYLPYLLCDSMINSCKEYGCEMRFYSLREDLSPMLPDCLLAGEYILLVNYYGQLTKKAIAGYQASYGRIIVDHTQSFFSRPQKGVDTLYSCRKFFGVPDGAYLSTDADLPYELETDRSLGRMSHILGRYEENASAYFEEMHNNARSYYQEKPKGMSRLTKNLLRGIDYERVLQIRNENYQYLEAALGQRNPLNWYIPDGPLAYPFYTEDGIRIRKQLAQSKIYIPTYWGNVIQDMPKNSVEYQIAANVLALPCDQRYGQAEMEYIVRMLKDCL